MRALLTRGRDAGKDENRKGVDAGDDVPWLSESPVIVVSKVTCVLVDLLIAVFGKILDLGRVGVCVACGGRCPDFLTVRGAR